MPSYPPKNDGSSSFDPMRSKEQRAEDAEKIRQDFIKSQRLAPANKTTQKPNLNTSQDEH